MWELLLIPHPPPQLQGVAAQSCTPNCDGANILDKVPDPENCTNYYVCFGDGIVSDHPVPCEAGNEFDNATRECVAAGGATCGGCDSGGGGGGELTCEVTCPVPSSSGTLDLISHIECDKYYVCLAGVVQGPFTCPSDKKYFNSETKECGTSNDKCCNRPCQPYCPAKNMLVPDPTSCKHFYYCSVDADTPDDAFRFECDAGKTFSLPLGQCTSDAECVTICQSTTSGTGQPGKSTTPSSSDCNESLTCTSKGYFPVCPHCDQRYLACTNVGEQATLSKCPGELMFDPNLHYCVLPENCS